MTFKQRLAYWRYKLGMKWLKLRWLPWDIYDWFVVRRRRLEAWRHPQEPMSKHIKITYDVVTPESAAHGDFEETGWENEEGVDMIPDQFDIDEGLTPADLAVKYLRNEGVIEASSSCFHVGLWYTTEGDVDYTDGSERRQSYHLYGFLPEEEREIYNRVFPRVKKPCLSTI